MPRLATLAALAALLCCTAPAMAAPQAVQAQYEVTLNGAPVGLMQEIYEAQDGRYRIVSETHATGVLALVQRRPARVTSSGEVTGSGLRPQTFEATRGSSSRRSRADFDWNARELTLSNDGHSEKIALPAGTQDRLSAMYQFLFIPPDRLRELAFAMTNGRKLDRYRYAPGPDTTLETPLGRLNVLHLVKQHAPGENATEIWLAREHGMMPVKMRILEEDGGRYEQTILRLDMPQEARP